MITLEQLEVETAKATKAAKVAAERAAFLAALQTKRRQDDPSTPSPPTELPLLFDLRSNLRCPQRSNLRVYLRLYLRPYDLGEQHGRYVATRATQKPVLLLIQHAHPRLHPPRGGAPPPPPPALRSNSEVTSKFYLLWCTLVGVYIPCVPM